MDEMSLVEMNDATERNFEGGGAMPLAMQQPVLGNLGQEGSQGVWYKNKTWIALMGLGLVATAFVAYAAMKEKE